MSRNDICHIQVPAIGVSVSSHVSIPPYHGEFPSDGTFQSLTLWSRILPSPLISISLPTSTKPPAREIKLYCTKTLKSLGLFVITITSWKKSAVLKNKLCSVDLGVGDTWLGG